MAFVDPTTANCIKHIFTYIYLQFSKQQKFVETHS